MHLFWGVIIIFIGRADYEVFARAFVSFHLDHLLDGQFLLCYGEGRFLLEIVFFDLVVHGVVFIYQPRQWLLLKHPPRIVKLTKEMMKLLLSSFKPIYHLIPYFLHPEILAIHGILQSLFVCK